VVKVVLWSGGGLIWRSQVGANPIPIPHPTNLSLFWHKITLYRFNQGGGSYYCRRLKSEQGAELPWHPHFNHWISLTNLRDAFISHSRSPNIVPFHMLDIVFYCAIVTLSLRRAVFTLFVFKNAVTLKNGVRGPSRSLEMSLCDRAHMISYWRSIVTMALSRVVSEIFNVEKCRDLEMGVKGHSRSLRVVSSHRLCMVSY